MKMAWTHVGMGACGPGPTSRIAPWNPVKRLLKTTARIPQDHPVPPTFTQDTSLRSHGTSQGAPVTHRPPGNPIYDFIWFSYICVWFYTKLSDFSMIVSSCYIFLFFHFLVIFYYLTIFDILNNEIRTFIFKKSISIQQEIQEARFWSPNSNFHFSQWFSYDFICLLYDFA